MSAATPGGPDVALDADGFLEDANDWTPEVGAAIARDCGIEPLTVRHWQVITYMRDTYLETGTAPSARTLRKASGVPAEELAELFPQGPAKLAARIGGIPRPWGRT